MRLSVVALSALLLTQPVMAADQPWFAFTRNDLIGFKDARGKVMIKPQFEPVATVALRFDHIIAVGEGAESDYRTYYLLKDGRQVGQRSVYYFDAKADCESEGTIRFRDRQTDKVGFLDQNGRVQIAAQFDDAEPLRNGVAWALRGATKVCAERGVSLDQCEHQGWQGGQKLLIDRLGKTLVAGFEADNLEALDWYSLTVNDQPPTDARRVSFKGVDGRYYSFVDIEKDFAAWFAGSFLPHLDTASLQANSYPRVWRGIGNQPFNDYKSGAGLSMIAANASRLRSRLGALRASGEYGVGLDSFSWPFEPGREPQYFDGCGNFAQWKTPIMSVQENMNHGSYEPGKHASFNFIRTAQGYRLFSFSLPIGK